MWLTADGVAVLDHDGRVKAGLRGPNAKSGLRGPNAKSGLRGPNARFNLRRRPVATAAWAELPASVPSLEELYAACGTAFELSVDVKDVAAAAGTVAVARAAGGGAPGRLWLCHPDWEVVAGWRAEFDDVRLVNSTRLKGMDRGPERRAAQLAAAGVDAVNLHYSDWTGGLTTLFHRFGRLAFGWDAQHERMVRDLARMGIDGVYSDHVDRLVEALGLSR